MIRLPILLFTVLTSCAYGDTFEEWPIPPDNATSEQAMAYISHQCQGQLCQCGGCVYHAESVTPWWDGACSSVYPCHPIETQDTGVHE